MQMFHQIYVTRSIQAGRGRGDERSVGAWQLLPLESLTWLTVTCFQIHIYLTCSRKAVWVLGLGLKYGSIFHLRHTMLRQGK